MMRLNMQRYLASTKPTFRVILEEIMCTLTKPVPSSYPLSAKKLRR